MPLSSRRCRPRLANVRTSPLLSLSVSNSRQAVLARLGNGGRNDVNDDDATGHPGSHAPIRIPAIHRRLEHETRLCDDLLCSTGLTEFEKKDFYTNKADDLELSY